MLTLLLSLLGTWIVAFVVSLELYGLTKEEYGMNLMFTFLLGSFIGMFVWGIASMVLEDSVTETRIVYTEYPIKSIKNDREVQGSFFLGCGTVNEYEYYYFFQVNEKGRFERVQIGTWKAEIEETDSKKPCIAYPYERTAVRKDKVKNYKWWFFNHENEYTKTTSPVWGENIIIYVPKGTILTKFELY